MWFLGLLLHHVLRQDRSADQNGGTCAFDSLAFLVVGQIGFYALGNSHTIGTVDFAGAYTGATRFGKVSTGSIAGLMVFTGPILFALLGASTFSRSVDVDTDDSRALLPLLVCVAYRAVVLAVYSVIAMSFRHHLFIWSVFAPKLVYEIGHFTVQVIVMCTVVGLQFLHPQSGKMKAM